MEFFSVVFNKPLLSPNQNGLKMVFKFRSYFKLLPWIRILITFRNDINNDINPKNTLGETCPNMEFFLVCIFLYSVRIQENMDHKKLRIRTSFTQWQVNLEEVLSHETELWKIYGEYRFDQKHWQHQKNCHLRI